MTASVNDLPQDFPEKEDELPHMYFAINTKIFICVNEVGELRGVLFKSYFVLK